MRDKARSLSARTSPARTGTALAAAIGLLGAGAGFGITALIPASGHDPAANARSAAVGAASVLPGSSRLTSSTLPLAAAQQGAKAPTVAPLHGLLQADLMVVASTSLPAAVLAKIRKLPGVTSAQSIEAAKIKVNGKFTAMLGVNPSTFRGYAAKKTAESDQLWQSVAAGGVSVSYTMGSNEKLPLGGTVTVSGAKQEKLRVGGYGTVGIEGIDAVVSDQVARSLGMPAGNAIVISAPKANLADLTASVKKLLPKGAAAEPLMSQVKAGVTSGQASAASVAAGAIDHTSATLSRAEDLTFLNSALSRQGLPYVWGAAGPKSFDCSGLVQWALAQAGIRMPRVAADQARTGPAVPVNQLQAGDLLFFHTDPTDPGYISHVAIYLGGGKMLQAPETGENVEVVPAATGSSEYAGAVRVDPALAAQLAGSI